MVKYPRMGRVKTRLGRGLGIGRAVNFYRGMMSGLFRKVSNDPRWQTVLAVSPDETIHEPCWPTHVWRISQRGGDLGARMGRIMTKEPSGSVVIIGADCPAIKTRDIADAFSRLKKHDVVFGPSEDGGYWLVGQKGMKRPDIFKNVRWSTQHARADTLKNCQDLRVGALRTLRDIDEVDDYKAWFRSDGL